MTYIPDRDASGNIVQRSVPQKTQELTMSRAIHDICRAPAGALQISFIDVENGIIHRQDLIASTYPVTVKIDDVVQTTGYTVDYSVGEVTFDASPGGEVKCSYHYPTDSHWSISPAAGKLLVIEHSEVQFTDDVSITDVLMFEVWVDNPFVAVEGHPLFGIPRIPGETIKYNSIRDIINESNLGYTVPTMPDIGRPLIIFPFNYVGEKILDSQMNAELIISCENDVELTGTYGTATFYLIERDV